MRKFESEELAKRIVHFYCNDGLKDVSATCRHFKSEGVISKTVRNIIVRYELRGTVEQKKRGCPVSAAQRLKLSNKIKKMLKINPTLSCREAAAKLNIPKSQCRRIHNIEVRLC